MPKLKKTAEHLIRLDDATYRAIMKLQLLRVSRGEPRLTLGQVVASLLPKEK